MKILEKLRSVFDLENLKKELKELESKTLEEGFYKNTNTSKVVLKDIAILKDKIKDMMELFTLEENILILDDFFKEEAIEEKEIEDELNIFIEKLEKFKMKMLLNDKYDKYDTILTINAGAGGTESCDWVNMLYRMYDRWANSKGFKVEVLDVLPGDSAGIKSITLSIKGDYSYGYLKSEKGVHRLVRISPFDSNSRRHTSFAAVGILPEIEDDLEVNLKKEDLIIDKYRASGAGGQHVNTTDSAIRITHIPTSIVVTCQNERSQLKNLESAMRVLKSKLFELEELKREKELSEIKGNLSKIEWGSQIRTYVFTPYKLVKDHRTNYEDTNIERIMDGGIDEFIEKYLKNSI